MRITVTGSTGNIGRPLTGRLLDAGADLTVIARSAGKCQEFAERGAHIVEGSHDSKETVRNAVEGADALFWLTPFSPAVENLRDDYNAFGDVVAAVARDHPKLHVVHLSSTGAHLAEGTGPVVGLYDIEQKLNAATKRLTHLRPTYFMENILGSLPTIASDGAIYSVTPGEAQIPAVATRDIAVVAADTLLAGPPRAPRAVHILGPEDLDQNQIAAIVSEAVGKPVRHVVIPPQQLVGALTGMGFSEDVARCYAELQTAIGEGTVSPPEGSEVVRGNTTLAQFAREVIAPAYHAAAGAATG